MLTHKPRMTPELRRQFITEKALKLSQSSHYLLFTRGDLARSCDVSPGRITQIFGSIDSVQNAVITMAIERQCVQVIAQAVTQKDDRVSDISDDLKQQAFDYIKAQ